MFCFLEKCIPKFEPHESEGPSMNLRYFQKSIRRGFLEQVILTQGLPQGWAPKCTGVASMQTQIARWCHKQGSPCSKRKL